MTEEIREGLVDRTMSNLRGAWRDIANSAARNLGLSRLAAAGGDAASLEALMKECLEARGGEVSARMRAAELGKTYLELDEEGKISFLTVMAERFAVDSAAVDMAITAYQTATEPTDRIAAEADLRAALEPPRVRLLTQFNALPEGVKFLVDLRADLLAYGIDDPAMNALDDDLRGLLASWFDVGFLDLKLITWRSSAALLEKLIDYEAVHQIRSWTDLRNRLDSDRRCYALFHPRMPEEPLAFVEVALVKGIAERVQDLLDEEAPEGDPRKADTAIFYSITNTQKGLKGHPFGEHLIKQVVMTLAQELGGLKTFATLSPIPGFRSWLKKQDIESLASSFTEEEIGGLRALGGSDEMPEALETLLDHPHWPSDPVVVKALKGPLRHLAARYLTGNRDDGQPLDPVARFHMKNGARMEKLNWLGDVSETGLRRSAGMMVNYVYDRGDMERNHEAYVREGKLALSSEIRSLAKGARGGESALKKLRLG